MGPGESNPSNTMSESSAVGNTLPAIKQLEHVHSSITKIQDPLDDENWAIWRERI
jgi:hypothetical protein